VRRKTASGANYTLSDGSSSPYVASLLGNLRHWLDQEPEIAGLIDKTKRNPERKLRKK